MVRDHKYDLKYQYQFVLEISAVIVLMATIIPFLLSKKFDTDVVIPIIKPPILRVVDIPVEIKNYNEWEWGLYPPIPEWKKKVRFSTGVHLYKSVPADMLKQPERIFKKFNPYILHPLYFGPKIESRYSIDKEPRLIGGLNAIYDYIEMHEIIMKNAIDSTIRGMAYVHFIVDTSGVPRYFELQEEYPSGLGFGKAAFEVMHAMRYTPGIHRSKPVFVYMSQTVIFPKK